MKSRKADALKQWKISPIDDQALKYWKRYSAARNEMLARSHTAFAPWTIVHSDDKHLARLNIIKDVLNRLHYRRKDVRLLRRDPQVVSTCNASSLRNGRLAE